MEWCYWNINIIDICLYMYTLLFGIFVISFYFICGAISPGPRKKTTNSFKIYQCNNFEEWIKPIITTFYDHFFVVASFIFGSCCFRSSIHMNVERLSFFIILIFIFKTERQLQAFSELLWKCECVCVCVCVCLFFFFLLLNSYNYVFFSPPFFIVSVV